MAGAPVATPLQEEEWDGALPAPNPSQCSADHSPAWGDPSPAPRTQRVRRAQKCANPPATDHGNRLCHQACPLPSKQVCPGRGRRVRELDLLGLLQPLRGTPNPYPRIFSCKAQTLSVPSHFCLCFGKEESWVYWHSL